MRCFGQTCPPPALALWLIADRWLARRALDKRGLAAWDADWLAAGLHWTPGRKARVVMTKVPGSADIRP